MSSDRCAKRGADLFLYYLIDKQSENYNVPLDVGRKMQAVSMTSHFDTQLPANFSTQQK